MIQDSTEMKIRRKNRQALLSIIFAATVVGSGIVALSYWQRSQVLLERDRANQGITRLRDTAVIARNARNTLDSLKKAAVEAEKRIPDVADFEHFYQEFTEHATKSGVVLREMKPGDARAEGKYIYLPILVEAEASFNDFHAFLFSWGQIEPIVTLEEISIQSGETSSCSINLVLRLYGKQGGVTIHG